MKIGLLGFVTDDANKGCEALTYSFIQLLSEIVEEPLEVVCYLPSGVNNASLQNYFSGIKISSKRIRIKDPRMTVLKEFQSCDYIFDITCGDGFSDIYFPKQVLYTTVIKALALIAGTPLILLPQTYGPFSNVIIEKFAMHVIKRSNRVYSRDEISSDYLNHKIRGKNVFTTTDLAFFLPYDSTKYSIISEKNFGINVSGLLWNGGFTNTNQFGLTVNYREYICEIIERLHLMGFTLHIIPHVVENLNDGIDGDVSACKELCARYPYLIMAPMFSNSIEAKSYISKMDIFTGARMHSTIAAISAGVPVIPFSYSRKFEGLYDSLDYQYMIHGKGDNTNAAIEQTIYFVNNIEMLQQKMVTSKSIINNYLQNFVVDLKNVLGVDGNE